MVGFLLLLQNIMIEFCALVLNKIYFTRVTTLQEEWKLIAPTKMKKAKRHTNKNNGNNEKNKRIIYIVHPHSISSMELMI